MITQKGLKPEDVVVIIGENSLSATFSVGFAESEKHSELKHYSSKEELNRKISDDLKTYMDGLATTEFTVAKAPETLLPEPEEPLNDSWGSLFNDLSDEVKTKLFRK